MTHEELQDLLAPYALGTLSGEERAALAAHLDSGCDACRRTLGDFQAAAAALPSSVPPQEPPARAKARLMGRLRAGRRFPWRRNLALAAGLLLTLGLGGLWFQRRAASFEVVGLAGTLRADGRPVQAGGRVRPGQRLAVGEGAHADIRLANRAVFRMKAGAQAVVTREQGGFLVRLDRGGVFSLVKPGNKFAVKTPMAAASVRGTVFYVQTDSPERTYACICHGRFHLEAPGLSQEMAAEHHNAVELTPAEGGVRSAPAGMAGHTDDEAAALMTHLP